ncbi:MAG: cysteine desulfurase [Cyanobacteria bacterium PR.3.49]|jgi:cysteine desulfurase/selenocysteine lyase|nr:cysteine desulfurase [Cyanobacteria bacterium PR.3.49]
MSKLNVEQIRKDFPILQRKIAGKQLVYLDNAATSQKPRSVIDALTGYYEGYNANIHRGIHTLAEEATDAYEAVRETVRDFIDAEHTHEIIFTRNSTEAINLVAYSWGNANILPGDEIVLTAMEHHSNLIPWQRLATERNAKLVFIPITEDGQLDMEEARKLISSRTKIVAATLMSNVLGTINPIKELAKLAHEKGAVILVDGAQGVPHVKTSVRDLDVDFLVFSMHKMLGPTGVGILYGKTELLDAMPPFLSGGHMISSVWKDKATWTELPWKFEAGTSNIADVIASGKAIEYLTALGMDNVREHEIEITRYALQKLNELGDITIFGPKDATLRGGVISFNVDDIHAHDIGQICADAAIAVRAGHHCCQPLMRDLNVMGTARASFYIYNTKEEVDLLFEALKEADKVLGHVACR